MFLSGREEVSHILTPVVYRLYCHILPMLMDDLPYHYRSPVMLIDSNPHGFNPWVQSPMLLVRSPQKHDEAPSNPDPPTSPPGIPPGPPSQRQDLKPLLGVKPSNVCHLL